MATATPQDFTGAISKDKAIARPNIVGPYGSSTWTPGVNGGPDTQTTTLNPAGQKQLTGEQNTGAGLATGAANMTPWAVGAESGPMDYSKFMAGGSRVNGGQYYDKAAGDAVYKQFADRQEPQFQRDTAALETQLRNQGLKPGDEAWNDQMRQNNQSIADQREQAQTHAQEVAASEGSRMQGMDISGGNYNTDQRTQQITEALQKRGYGVDEIAKMLQTAGTPGMPSAPNGAVGSQYSDALARMYGQSNNSAQNTNEINGSWMNLFGKVLTNPTVDSKIIGPATDWLSSYFKSPDATGSTSAAATAAASGDSSLLGDTTSQFGSWAPAGTTAISDLAQGKSLGTTAVDSAKAYGENAAKTYVKNAVTGYLGASAAAPAATSAMASAVAGGDAAALGAADGSAFAAAPSFTMAGAVPTAAAPAAAAPAAATPAASAGGFAGAVAIPAAITYAALTTAPVRLQAKWWSNLNQGLTSGKSGNATYDANTPPDQQIYNSKMSLYRMLSSGGSKAIMGGASGENIPQAFKDKAMSYGMLNKDGSVNQHWDPGIDPFVAAQRKKTGYVMGNNGQWVHTGGVSVGSGSGKAA